jgi:hypothetical protein
LVVSDLERKLIIFESKFELTFELENGSLSLHLSFYF